MKKYIPALLTFFLLLSISNTVDGQCYTHDTTVLHWARTLKPYAIAISAKGRLAITEAYKDSIGKKGMVKIWKDVYDFGGGLLANDSILLTSPKGVAFDSSDNLYVVQSERSDSNIVIYDTSLTLIKAINNGLGASSWTRPRGIGIDSLQNVYVVSGNSFAADSTTIPYTGKIIRITDPLGAATKSTVISGLDSAMGISIAGNRLYVTEYSKNRISEYSMGSYLRLDTAMVPHPLDIAVQGCKGFVTEKGANTVDVFNAYSLNDTSTATRYVLPVTSSGSKLGVQLNGQHDLLMCDNKFNRVVIFRGIVPQPVYGLPSAPSHTVTFPLHLEGNICRGSVGYLFHWGPWISSDSSVAWVDSNDVVHAGSLPGTVTFYSTIDTQQIILHLTIEAPISFYPSAIYAHTDSGDIYGSATVCYRNTIRLRDNYPNGHWYSSNDEIAVVGAGGSVWPLMPGATTIYYGLQNSCGISGVQFDLTITGKPANHAIAGDAKICYANTAVYSGSGPNGAWSIDNETIATIDDAGTLHPLVAGDVQVIYTIDNGCDYNDTTLIVHIDTIPSAGSIYGTDSVCIGDHINLYDTSASATGYWHSNNAAIATVDSLSGALTGVADGTAEIVYIVKNACDSVYTSINIRVKGKPDIGALSGDNHVCEGDTVAWSHPALIYPGAWSATANVTISASGLVIGVTHGTATISYIAENSCGADTSTGTITVNPLPHVGTISGPSHVCPGATISLTSTTTDTRVWASLTPAIATINSSGRIGGVSPGPASVKLTATNSCGSTDSTFIVTVDSLPVAGTISGPEEICGQYPSEPFTISGSVGTGIWSTSDPYLATISGSGVVTPLWIGGVNIIHTSSTVCGTASVSSYITMVNYLVAYSIVTSSPACVGDEDFISFPDFLGTVTGENCYSSNVAVASAYHPWWSTGSFIDYISPGTATIYYNGVNACGWDETSTDVTVFPLPSVGTINGPSSICIGTTNSLSSTSTSTITWTSLSPAIATINSSGIIGGVSPGVATIKVTATTPCGSVDTMITITVEAFPVASIVGPSSVCRGSSISLSGVVSGGTWSSSDASIATVSSTGVVGGAAYLPSSATISYTVTTGCGTAATTFPISVSIPPNPGFITGADSLCMNSFDTVRNHAATPGGSWRSRHGLVQFLSAASGIDTLMFKGILAGNDTLVYTVVNECGADSALFHVRVNALPSAGAITGPAEVCVFSTIALSDTAGTPGGTWTSSAPWIADVDPTTGIVTGNSAGSADIVYTGITSCGSVPDIHIVTVNELPYTVLSAPAGVICLGSTFTLSSSYSPYPGTWSSSDGFIATVNPTTGIITAANAGNATISYTIVSPLCGLYTATRDITVNPLPAVAAEISGADSLCSGTSITLTDATLGGAWVSGSPSVILVTSDGVVTGTATTLSTGIIYYVISTTACGSDTAVHAVTVKPQPDAGAISGPSAVCAGNMIFLSSTGMSGGTWSSSLPVATVTTIGMVTGINAGSTTISYTVVNSCGADYATTPVTVLTVPSAPSVSGADSFCVGTVSAFSGTPASGTWSFYYGFASVISTTGTTANLYASYAGYDTVYYTMTNACGSATAAKPIHLLTLPYTGYILAGADSLCPGNTTTVTDPSAAGSGIWGHTGSNISISATGVITALTPGTDMVLYTLTNSCGSVAASRPITVHNLPVAGSISGPAGICIGTSVSLTNTGGTPGGAWSCSAGSITSSGVFTGSSAGTVTITYTATTPCGNAYAYFPIVVNPLPTVGAITMPSSICSGTSVTASDAAPDGFWSISPVSIATITSLTGVVTGLSAGSATVTYSVTNLCGTSAVVHPLAVQTLPTVSPIIGVPNVCPGSTSVLTSGPAGGTWTASNGHATISSSGLLTGVSPGVDTISYSITNSCGTAAAQRIATIYPVPGTDTISGSSIACIGLPVTLTAAVPGGTWTSTGGHTTVSGGVVYGIATGVDTIRYAESNSCGSATLSHLMTVHDTVSVSVTASVSPNDTICGVAPVTLTATPLNGGSSPSVVWYNGTTVLGSGVSYSYTPADGDIVHCVMVSNAICPTPATAISNNLGLEVYPHVTPVVTVTASPSDTVAFIGQSITFTATLTNCGSSPVYQWYENGTAITGATNATYTTTAAGSDAYYCIAACDTPCAIAVYNHSNVVTLYTGHVGMQALSGAMAQYSVAPNPNTGTFMLDGHGIRTSDVIRFDVLDMAGRQVSSGSLQPVNGRVHNQVMLDVASGQYMLRVFDGQAVLIFRVDVLK